MDYVRDAFQRLVDPKQPEPTWLEKNVTKISFAVSALASFIFSSFSLFILGTAIGYMVGKSVTPHLKLKEEDQIIIVTNAVLSIVGGVAAVLKHTPAGALGGLVFQALPLLGSYAFGRTLHRAACALGY